MARIRTIKPEFWTDEKVTECSLSARLLYIGMWNFADDYGNLEASSKRIKMQVFPADNINTEELINELSTHGLLTEYSLSNKNYLHINGFQNHQRINRPSNPIHPQPNLSEASVSTQAQVNEDSLPEKEKEKEKEKDNTKSKNKFSDLQMNLGRYFYSTLLTENPDYKKPNFDSWANTIRLACESDNRSLEDLRKVWDWARQDNFWQGNIFSPEKLRKQFDQLILKIKQSAPPAASIYEAKTRPNLVDVMKQQIGDNS